MKVPINIYRKNIAHNEARVLQLEKVLTRLSVLRLVAFVCSAALILVLANERLVAFVILVAALCVLGFGLLINRYNRLAYLKRHASFLQKVNEFELLRLENKLSSFPDGHTFIHRDHPYVSDLDTFGPHSLFQLINRTTTESGQALLAEWLAAPAPEAVILERQEGVRELVPKLDWRQHFQATGMHFQNAKSDYNKLLAWIEKPVKLLPRRATYLAISILLSILSALAVVYAASSGHTFSFLPLLIVLFINSRVLGKVKPIAQEVIENAHYNTKILGGYQALITRIESEKFDSTILRRLQTVFRQHTYSAAGEINKLKKILALAKLKGTGGSSVGSNLFYPLINIFCFLDVYWILSAEKWKVRNSAYLRAWASAVGEFEVLSSVAGFSYSNPTYSFPEIKQEAYHLHFEMLGHPLINPESRICNDFQLMGRGEIALITGSNMAGKSTFLRTVGINLVLAFMGAPCCAKAVQVSSMKIFSSMRTQDNLEEGVSSFYAELKRMEQLLALIESGQAVFFLLDELFKGTNSKDRYKGGVSLIKQLSDLNAFGLISTHDLELAKLASSYTRVANYSFNSTIRDGEMIFDYTLTKGICRDFNASELMKRSGIKILSTLEQPS